MFSLEIITSLFFRKKKQCILYVTYLYDIYYINIVLRKVNVSVGSFIKV